MPPKPKFTVEEVLDAALAIVRESGEEALTARSLGTALNSSTRPLFTLFDSMDDLKNRLAEGPVRELFWRYYEGFSSTGPAFKRFGLMLVSFAADEPNLFRFLFISDHGKDLSLKDWSGGPLRDEAIAALRQDWDIDDDLAEAVFEEMWLHTYALCVLKATGTARLTDTEISESLSRCFQGLMHLALTGKFFNVVGNVPEA